MPKDKISFQKELFDKVARVSKADDWATEVADVLNIEKPYVYKRMRGEVYLKPDELAALSRHYQISLDSILTEGEERNILFESPVFIQNPDDFNDYLIRTEESLQRAAQLEDHCLYYAARDLPLFVYFLQESIARFKIAVWLHGLYEKNPREFLTDYPRQSLDTAMKIADLYRTINSRELWTDSTLYNLLKQIEYYHATNFIDKSFALQLCEDLGKLLDEIYQMCEDGHKGGSGKFMLYRSDFLMMPNNGLMLSSQVQMTFISYAGINYVRTFDRKFCRDIKAWFELQYKRSEPLHLENEKNRQIYFAGIRSELEKTNEAIRNYS